MDVCRLALAVLAVCCIGGLTHAEERHEGQYLNEWAAEIHGGEQHARSVAAQHGYTLVDSLNTIPDVYLLKRSDVAHKSRRSADHHTVKLTEDRRVRYVAQQQSLGRAKRGVTVALQEREEREQREMARTIAKGDGNLNDPQMTQEWYISPSEMHDGKTALGVKECWKKGLTGKGVVVTILDDGIEHTHADLAANYDSLASIDLNGKDDNPFPRYDPTNENKHGTRCAGEIAMIANNGECGTGIAFDSKIGGVRMLDGHVTDHLEADAIGFNRKYVDIYSASWGPNDDGKTTEMPGPMATKAFELGIKEGRGGLGALYVWASGNGGRIGDNCNSDGYTSSIYSMSISSATEKGNSPWYGEKCSSTLATTYSSGSSSEGKVTSADLHGKCTNAHSGTSAAAPMAAGLYALLLEQNSNLTWRDVQHITAYTSRMQPLGNATGWYKNGAGFCVNLAFGHGLMNAEAMVDLADPATWENVGEQHVCKVKVGDAKTFPQTLSAGGQVEVEFTTDGCQGQDNEVNFLEHVQAVLDLDYSRRGNIYAELQSPMGTITTLMLERKVDSSKFGFKSWPLMTTHSWGEQPNGTWIFRVADKKPGTDTGTVKGMELVLHGTKEQPAYQATHGAKDCGASRTVSTESPSHHDTDDKDLQAYDALSSLMQQFSEHKVQPQPKETETSSLTNALTELLHKLRV